MEMGRPNVLLVEDDLNDLHLTLRAIGSGMASAEVRVARDGEEALNYLVRQPPGADRPRVVFLDLKLPKVSGLDVLRQIRAHPSTRLIPVVVLSSSNDDRDVRDAYRSGANSYVVKPVDFDRFTQAVREAGLYWLGLNQPLAE